MLDEALEILTAAWSGEPVYHREHYTVDGMRFLPRPVQRPGVPVWVGGYPESESRFGAPSGSRGSSRSTSSTRTSSPRSSLRSPRFAGDREDVKEPFDVVAALPVGTDPAPYASAGATWWMVEFPWDGVSVDQVRGVIRDGPAPSG